MTDGKNPFRLYDVSSRRFPQFFPRKVSITSLSFPYFLTFPAYFSVVTRDQDPIFLSHSPFVHSRNH